MSSSKNVRVCRNEIAVLWRAELQKKEKKMSQKMCYQGVLQCLMKISGLPLNTCSMKVQTELTDTP